MGTDFCMKTTLDFDDRLIRAAKARAAEDGESLTKLIERALRDYLETPCAPAQPYRAGLLIKHGRPLDGVDLDDRDKLYERMEELDDFSGNQPSLRTLGYASKRVW